MVVLGPKLSVCSLQTHGFIHDLLWGLRGYDYLHNNMQLLFTFDICTDETEAVVGETFGTLAQIKAVAPNY